MATLVRGIRCSLLYSIRNSKLVTTMAKRSIMSTKVKLEKVMEDLQKNPYYDKYADKIAKFQKTSPEEFLELVEAKERKIQEEKEKRAKAKTFHQTTMAKSALQPGAQMKQATLDEIMKIELILDKTKEEISDIWQQYHKHKECISGILTRDQFMKMFDRGQKYPIFLLPLPREQGYEFIMIQFYNTEIHMTPLLWYQTHKENAPECMTMIHYTDLMDSKEIVLMRGEFDSNTINVQEAQCLANELQMYYSFDNPKRLNLLDTFTNKPNTFKHMDLIAQLENISINSNASSSFSNSEK